MAILTVRNKASTTLGKHVGVILSQQISSYLSLYALSKGVTKSMIVRDQMKEWYRSKRTINSTKDLITTIVVGIDHEWKLRNKSPYPILDIESFKKDLEIELLQKGISKEDIESILTRLDCK